MFRQLRVAYFDYFEARPFTTSLCGLAFVIAVAVLAAVVLGHVMFARGWPGWTVLLAALLAALVTLAVLRMIVDLASEALWRRLRVYRLLGLRTRPLREGVIRRLNLR